MSICVGNEYQYSVSSFSGNSNTADFEGNLPSKLPHHMCCLLPNNAVLVLLLNFGIVKMVILLVVMLDVQSRTTMFTIPNIISTPTKVKNDDKDKEVDDNDGDKDEEADDNNIKNKEVDDDDDKEKKINKNDDEPKDINDEELIKDNKASEGAFKLACNLPVGISYWPT